MNKFEIVGKISKPKSDKVKFFEERTTDSGWLMRNLKFNVKSGSNNFQMEISDGRNSDESKAMIYSSVKNAEGKYDNVQFPYKDREQYIPSLAEFKKSVIVFDKDNRLEFATQFDMALALRDIIDNEEYKDKTFKFVGEVEYSRYKDKEYKKMIPTRVYLTDEEESATGTLDLLFGEYALDDTNFEDTKTVFINGYAPFYDRTAKKQLAFAQQVEYNLEKVHGDNYKKAYQVLKNIFDISSDNLHKIGFKVIHINGAEEVPFSMDIVTDEDRDMYELGFISLEDLKANYGVGKGTFTSKVLATGLTKTYMKGAIDTEHTLEFYQEDKSSEEEIFDMFS